MEEKFPTSERRVCGLMSIAVSSFRYCSKRSDEVLMEKLARLAREKPRYGYRRLQVLLEREGERVNHKRLYREAGLCLKRKKRRHCVRVGSPRPVLSNANQEWALDFLHDVLAAGRNIRVLSVVDAFTRECLALEVDTGFASRRVTRVLDEIIAALKQVEAGRTVDDVARECGVSVATIYAWKAKYGGLEVSEAQRLRSLEDENSRLKRLMADLSLDKEMLKAVIAKIGLSS